MDVGKHRLSFFNAILRDDPDYADWAASLQAPSELMIGFQRYVQQQRKRPREPGFDNVCSICMDSTIDSAFIPCGHQAACIECARKLRGPCVICRSPIADILQTKIFLNKRSFGERNNLLRLIITSISKFIKSMTVAKSKASLIN